MLLIPHINKPNMVALSAGVLGADNINISGMQVAQSTDDQNKSIMIISTDTKVENSTLEKIVKIDGVDEAKYISLEA